MSADPYDTEERRALRALTIDFAAREIAPHLSQWEEEGELPRSLHAAAAEVGLLGIGFPTEVGGSGGDLIDVVVMTEGLLEGGASGGVISGLFSHGIALPHVVDEVRRRQEAGDGDSARRLVDEVIAPVLRGERIAALGVTEPDGGSDVAHLRTRAVPQPDGSWAVSGAKTFITSGVRADTVVAAVRTGGEGAAGISLALLDPHAPGYAPPRRLAKMGWHCSDTAELSFDEVPIAADDLIAPGEGFASLARHFVSERISIAATAYSTAQRSLDLTLDWARHRETFGRPLASRQVVRHTLVEMRRQIDVARTYTRQVAARHAAGDSVIVEAVFAKKTAVDACMYVVDQAVQLHGGMGYMRESEVERHYRDARVLGIGGGATEVMTDLAARLMGI
ncbi:MAG: acyl-CoA dehydrogenase family protein [Candidatus Nanopelagicales bacterium]